MRRAPAPIRPSTLDRPRLNFYQLGVPMMRHLYPLTLFPLLVSLTACASTSRQAPKTTANSNAPPAVGRARLEAPKVSYAMRGNEDNFRKCFMRSMQSRGAVSIHFDLSHEGIVEQSEVTASDLNSPNVEQCLVEALAQTRFGERAQDTEADWTFVFRLTDPVDEDERESLLEELDEDMTAFRLMGESVGRIDEAALDERIQVRYPLYAHCYRDSIKRRGESRGVVKFRLDISKTGRLTALEDAGSVLPDAYAVDCMAEAFYAMDYPAPTGGKVSIEYRLDFE